MPLPNEQPLWRVNAADVYLPISYDGSVVGYCKPAFAARIIETLNDEQRYAKALQMACADLARRTGGAAGTADLLMERYLNHAEQPRSGVKAIAVWLKDRQEELDVSDAEFERFCESYRLPKRSLQAIYAGHEIDSRVLTPLARILGCSVEDVLTVLEGSSP
ncbi:hypothetical protein ACQ4M4_17480 [Leptolyngbya sp. AN02str]|uniref:hypothetical protein n=1 Tax=Leptolyngbya sp. AN02str TaxID=3423363 RepID=UPI003D31E068